MRVREGKQVSRRSQDSWTGPVWDPRGLLFLGECCVSLRQLSSLVNWLLRGEQPGSVLTGNGWQPAWGSGPHMWVEKLSTACVLQAALGELTSWLGFQGYPRSCGVRFCGCLPFCLYCDSGCLWVFCWDKVPGIQDWVSWTRWTLGTLFLCHLFRLPASWTSCWSFVPVPVGVRQESKILVPVPQQGGFALGEYIEN